VDLAKQSKQPNGQRKDANIKPHVFNELQKPATLARTLH
jgi:hypothetical protein